MKNIHEILKEAGLEVPEDKKKDFDKAMNDNYKTVSEVQKVKDKLDTATKDLETANDKITELGNDLKSLEKENGDVKDLKKKVEDYELAEKKRKDEAEAAEADAKLTETVMEAIKDKEFINDYTKNSIIAEVKQGVKENTGKGAKEIFESLTKDKEGIFKNPHQITKLEPNGGGTEEDGPGFKSFW